MAVSLTELQGGGLSLEFRPEDEAAVADAIKRRFGVPIKIRDGAFEVSYQFGGEEFIYYGEWDQPCLISGSVAGSEILKDIARELKSGA